MEEDAFFSFSLPDGIDSFDKLGGSDVCVVSVIGKAPLHGNKSALFKRFLNRNEIFIGDTKPVSSTCGPSLVTCTSSTETD